MENISDATNWNLPQLAKLTGSDSEKFFSGVRVRGQQYVDTQKKARKSVLFMSIPTLSIEESLSLFSGEAAEESCSLRTYLGLPDTPNSIDNLDHIYVHRASIFVLDKGK